MITATTAVAMNNERKIMNPNSKNRIYYEGASRLPMLLYRRFLGPSHLKQE